MRREKTHVPLSVSSQKSISFFTRWPRTQKVNVRSSTSAKQHFRTQRIMSTAVSKSSLRHINHRMMQDGSNIVHVVRINFSFRFHGLYHQNVAPSPHNSQTPTTKPARWWVSVLWHVYMFVVVGRLVLQTYLRQSVFSMSVCDMLSRLIL